MKDIVWTSSGQESKLITRYRILYCLVCIDVELDMWNKILGTIEKSILNSFVRKYLKSAIHLDIWELTNISNMANNY